MSTPPGSVSPGRLQLIGRGLRVDGRWRAVVRVRRAVLRSAFVEISVIITCRAQCECSRAKGAGNVSGFVVPVYHGASGFVVPVYHGAIVLETMYFFKIWEISSGR